MIFQESGVFVESDASGSWVVFRPSKSGTHAESDSAFAPGRGGLSIAIARAMYLSRGAQPGQAKEALRLASEYMGKAKAHGRKARNALAAFDAEFMV